MSFIQPNQVDFNNNLQILNTPLRKQKNLLINTTIKIKELYYNIQIQEQIRRQQEEDDENDEDDEEADENENEEREREKKNNNENKRENIQRIPSLDVSSFSPSFSSSTTIIDNYSIEDVIGTGNFSNVYSAYLESNPTKYALKTIFSEVSLLGLREIIFLRHLSSKTPIHSNFFVRVYDAFSFRDQLTIVFKCFDGTLMDYIRRMPVSKSIINVRNESLPSNLTSSTLTSASPLSLSSNLASGSSLKQLFPKPIIPLSQVNSSRITTPTLNDIFVRNFRKLASKLLSALWILKSEGIIHGDIKPENIFVTSNNFSFQNYNSNSNHNNHHVNNNKININNYQQFKSGSGSKRKRSLEQFIYDLGIENNEIDFILGDFGNAFLVSESKKFYRDFNIQSLPYRSPEVLCGIPFNHQIDIWSVGIILLEICLGRTLFSCETREELFLSQCHLLSPLQSRRFTGGRYSRELFSLQSTYFINNTLLNGNQYNNPFQTSSSSLLSSSLSSITTSSVSSNFSNNLTFSDHYRNIYNLLHQHQHTNLIINYPTDMIHFIASLLYPDPDIRLNIQDALQHNFISSSISIPMSLWNGNQSSNNKYKGRNNRIILSLENFRALSNNSNNNDSSNSNSDNNVNLTNVRINGNCDFSSAEMKEMN